MQIKHPLFWKIFVGFFITFIAILVSVWLVFIFYDANPDMHPPPPKEMHPKLPIPFNLLLVGIIGGLVFSGILAWYMVQPIHRLRWGFAQLAEGKLNVRLQKVMGNRHDEMADLARDFDHMAEQMEGFVNSRNQLLHDVSHELRSPLARLNIAMALLEQDPSRRVEIIKRVKTETQHLDNMTEELLTLFRAENDVSQIDNYIDLKSLVDTVIQDVKFEADALGIKIKTNVRGAEELPGTAYLLKGNSKLLHRAIENVMRNALCHTDNDKCIEVNLLSNPDAQCYSIFIRDHGLGVPEEKLCYMFESFIRVSSKNQKKGFGLGLAIAHRAVLVHKGSIKAENYREGGLMVTITLPFNTTISIS